MTVRNNTNSKDKRRNIVQNLSMVYRSDKLRLVLNSGYAKHHPVRLRLPPLHRRGMVRPYTYADMPQPPRQASPATPPQEGNGPPLYLCRHATTTPSGFACHPSTGGEWSAPILMQTCHNHPVRLRLPPLHRRGMVRPYTYADMPQPPRQAAPATPPQERNGPPLYLCRHATTTPSGCACHPSTGEEWSAPILMQTCHNHPVRLRLPPLHRRGMVRHYTYADTPQSPRQAAPATPPQEGNCLVQGDTLGWFA